MLERRLALLLVSALTIAFTLAFTVPNRPLMTTVVLPETTTTTTVIFAEGGRKRRRRRRVDPAETTSSSPPQETAADVSLTPRQDAPVSMAVTDVRNLVGGGAPATTTTAAASTTTTTTTTPTSVSPTAASPMATTPNNNNNNNNNNNMEDSLAQLLADAQEMQQAVNLSSYILKYDTVQIAFNSNFERLVQPALGILMISALAGNFFAEDEEDPQMM